MRRPTLASVSSPLAIVIGACCVMFAWRVQAAPSSPVVETPAQTDAEAADQAVAELMEHHRHHHHGGVTKFIAMSLDTLGVAPAKEPKIDRLQKRLYVCMIPARDLEAGLLTILADGVAIGSVDAVKADATIGQLDAVASAVNGCSEGTLNKLHAVLSQAERVSLVDKVQAHADAWRQANSEAAAGGREKGGRLAALAGELNLTPDQVDKISAALQTDLAPLAGQFDPAMLQDHVQTFSKAFLQKSFNADLLTANVNGHIATYGAKRMALFYETAAPLLTPVQRATLAQHLREHAGRAQASATGPATSSTNSER
jgi:hypothetical protein